LLNCLNEDVKSLIQTIKNKNQLTDEFNFDCDESVDDSLYASLK
jgi:hypothetical protein